MLPSSPVEIIYELNANELHHAQEWEKGKGYISYETQLNIQINKWNT